MACQGLPFYNHELDLQDGAKMTFFKTVLKMNGSTDLDETTVSYVEDN